VCRSAGRDDQSFGHLLVRKTLAACRLLERVCTPPLSEHCLRAHRDAGVDLLLEKGVTEILGDDTVRGVLLSDGTTLPAGVVVVGVGAGPQISLAEKLGVDCRRGMVVDASGRTTHPRIFAVGDCTVQPHPHLDGELLALESVNNAVEQGRAAAHALLGLEPPARGVPWFWSDQGAMKIQIAGISHGYDDYVVRSVDGRLTVLYYRAGRLIAGEAVDIPRDFLVVRRALAEGKTVDRERAEDLSFALKQAGARLKVLRIDAIPFAIPYVKPLGSRAGEAATAAHLLVIGNGIDG